MPVLMSTGEDCWTLVFVVLGIRGWCLWCDLGLFWFVLLFDADRSFFLFVKFRF